MLLSWSENMEYFFMNHQWPIHSFQMSQKEVELLREREGLSSVSVKACELSISTREFVNL